LGNDSRQPSRAALKPKQLFCADALAWSCSFE
jgi:hypothetical protein